VVCVCDAVRESHAARMPRLENRFVTVRNGISSAAPRDRAAARATLGLAPEARAILTVGSLTKQKAQHVLLEAFATVARADARATLLVAGSGPRAEELAARSASLGIADRVHWLGARDDVGDLLAACDVFALSSEREGLPVTLLEAMRAERPVVSTRAGGCGEAVADGITGRLVAVGDAAALGEALRGTLADPAAAAGLGRAGRARWAERFTAERMVRETEALCVALLHRGPATAEAHA
jgi:glycosyltransferase involved in cell wall biosynthesis